MADHDRTTTTTTPPPPQSTVTHVETTRSSGNSALWLILGIAIAALAAYFLFFSGADVAGTSGGGDTTINVDNGASEAVEGAASAVEGAGEAVEGAAEATTETVTGN